MTTRELGFLFVALGFLVFGVECAYGQDLDCRLLTDMALVSRALAEDKVTPEQSERIMLRIYARTEPSIDIIRALLSAAGKDGSAPSSFAERIGTVCSTGVKSKVKT